MSLDVHLKGGVTLPSPLMTAEQLSQLGVMSGSVRRIDFTFPAAAGVPGARCSFAQLSTTPLSSSDPPGLLLHSDRGISRSEERRVGKEWGFRWCAGDVKRKKKEG